MFYTLVFTFDHVSSYLHVFIQGVSTILPYLEKRVVEIDLEDMCKLLRSDNGNENYPREKLKCNESLRGLSSGSVVLTTNKSGLDFYCIGFIFSF